MEPFSKLHHDLVGGREATVLLTASPGTAPNPNLGAGTRSCTGRAREVSPGASFLPLLSLRDGVPEHLAGAVKSEHT